MHLFTVEEKKETRQKVKVKSGFPHVHGACIHTHILFPQSKLYNNIKRYISMYLFQPGEKEKEKKRVDRVSKIMKRVES